MLVGVDLAVLLVEQDAERQMERVQALLPQSVAERLDARLVRDRRIGERVARAGGSVGSSPRWPWTWNRRSASA